MATVLQQVREAFGNDKFVVLAAGVDQALLATQRNHTLDDQIETLDVHQLSVKFNVTFETLRKQITDVLGPGAVFKLGKSWIIRKQTYLQYLQQRERLPENA